MYHKSKRRINFQIGAISYEEGTRLRVEVLTSATLYFDSSTYESGTPLTLTLGKDKVFHITQRLDLNPLRILSNKQISVYTGAR